MTKSKNIKTILVVLFLALISTITAFAGVPASASAEAITPEQKYNTYKNQDYKFTLYFDRVDLDFMIFRVVWNKRATLDVLDNPYAGNIIRADHYTIEAINAISDFGWVDCIQDDGTYDVNKPIITSVGGGENSFSYPSGNFRDYACVYSKSENIYFFEFYVKPYSAGDKISIIYEGYEGAARASKSISYAQALGLDEQVVAEMEAIANSVGPYIEEIRQLESELARKEAELISNEKVRQWLEEKISALENELETAQANLNESFNITIEQRAEIKALEEALKTAKSELAKLKGNTVEGNTVAGEEKSGCNSGLNAELPLLSLVALATSLIIKKRNHKKSA